MCQIDLMKMRVQCITPNEPDYVFIMWKKKGQIGVCKPCWAKIGNKNWECGTDPRPKIEELLSDSARFGENPIETEYKPKESNAKEVIEEDEY